MNKKTQQNRNQKGDIVWPDSDSNYEFWNKMQYTHVFCHADDESKDFIPFLNLSSPTPEEIEEAQANSEYFERKLYKMPASPPYDNLIFFYNWQLSLLMKFFKEVFEEKAFLNGHLPTHKFYQVILSKSKYSEIMNFINDYELLHIRDLLFEVISSAQKHYIDHIAFWEKPEQQKLIRTAEKESKKVIEVIEKLDYRMALKGKLSHLSHINFVFSDGTIKIGHNWLAKEFIKHLKEHYDNLLYKNWKKELERYPSLFEENIRKQQFKYRLANSFYNLLAKEGFITVDKEEPTPNKIILCVVKLLEFCLIKISNEGERDERKIKIVRGWINRNEFRPDRTSAEILVDRTKLLKFFEAEFIDIPGNIKGLESISTGFFITKKYDLEKLFPDLTHIAAALREYTFHIGHQIIGDEKPYQPTFEEFASFSKLINGIKSGRKITDFNFRIEGDSIEHSLSQRLPIYLLEQALIQYSNDQQVEFDLEPVRTNVKKLHDGSIQVQKAKEFLQPEERFMVRFVKAFYNYLMSESPPNDSELFPSDRYYDIISDMLQKTWFFYHQRNPDWFVKSKVIQWHEMESQ